MAYTSHVVLDFEFNPVERQHRELIRDEIIEIGAIKLDADLNEVGRFTCLVKPELNAHISPKIQRLTGIRDCDMENATDFATAIDSFAEWIGAERTRVYSWSDNDLKQLENECWLKNVDFPLLDGRWMDFQKVWQRTIHYPQNRCLGLHDAATFAGIDMDEGKAHRALYDSEITAALLKLLKDESYRANLRRAKMAFAPAVDHISCPLGTACQAQLLELMNRLSA